MSSKHTPGPWSADWNFITTEARSKPFKSEPDRLGQVYIAQLCDADEEGLYVEDTDELEANAALIAAAPEMYDFIETVARGNTNADVLQRMARKLLASMT